MSWKEWLTITWDERRTLLEGLSEDEEVGFRLGEDDGFAGMQGGPTVRENVDAGTDVIDLAAMRAELEAARAERQKGGG